MPSHPHKRTPRVSTIHNIHANPGRSTHTPALRTPPVFHTGLEPVPETNSWEHPLRRAAQGYTFRDLQLI